MSSTFFVLLGESGSGKDFTASLVGYPVVKFASPYKRQLERFYGLPLGALEHRAIKSQVMPGSSMTFLDALVAEYHIQKDLYDHYGWQQFYKDRYETNIKEVLFYMENNLPVMFTDVRNTYEAEVVRHLAEANWCDIVAHRLYRNGSESLSSDGQIESIGGILQTSERFKKWLVSENASPEQIKLKYSDYRLAT